MSIEIKIPDIGIDEVEVTEIMVKVGDYIATEQSLIAVEGDKVSMEIPSPCDGIVKEINISIGDKVNTGSHIMVFESKDITSVPDESEIYESSSFFKGYDKEKDRNNKNNINVHATPVIRRLAREYNINLNNVKGRGRKGRILREDIQEYIDKSVNNPDISTSIAVSNHLLSSLLTWPKINFNEFGAIEEVELTKFKKNCGMNLHRNWVMIPHVTQFDEADITEVESFRKQQNNQDDKTLDVKITILVFIMKAVAKALEEFPYFNSSLSADGQKLILKKYINIGVAIDTPKGLVVPVFRNINKQGILELSCNLVEISKKARAGNLIPIDVQGGCFTISSLGGIGGTAFTPIINVPEVAILGLSKSFIKPIWNGEKFIPRLMLPLSLSYDHRVIDGVAGIKFIKYISWIMSDIRRILI